MSEQEKRDTRDLATLLKDLPKEDRLQIQGVIAGLKLARKGLPVEDRREPARSALTGRRTPLKKKGVCRHE